MSMGSHRKEEVLHVLEIHEKFKGQWVAIRVVERDENYQPIKGIVIASDVDKYRLKLNTVGEPDICIFYAGEPDYPLVL